ncbi:MAG: type II toxin-antitoxin system VapC family toxin [Alphaproteobacteria bacterium]|nr:type II toxin-antitoxin system VapC family toxin [Alphaproteobacteria bacterium]
MRRSLLKPGVVLRAVDTNVLARLLANDDPEQADIAQKAMTAEPVFVPKTVMLELEWVLRSSYRLSPPVIATGFEGLLAAANVSVEDSVAVARAVGWFRRGMDFADALHLASSSHVDSIVTFDRGMRRRVRALGAKPQAVAP